jgi:PHD/YefM family antitoxin component YafN of YafNO toxin-antitoxin module
MEIMTATAAKTNFGSLLLKVQSEPVEIKKNDETVAVMMSAEEFSMKDAVFKEFLKNRFAAAEEDMKTGNLVDGETFMNELLAGKYD